MSENIVEEETQYTPQACPQGHKTITRGNVKVGDLFKPLGESGWKEVHPKSSVNGRKITEVLGMIARPTKKYAKNNLTFEKRYHYNASVLQQYKDTATLKLECDGEILGLLRGSPDKILSLLTLFNSRANNLPSDVMEFYDISFTHVMRRNKIQ